MGSRFWELPLSEGYIWLWVHWGTRFPWVWEPSEPNVVPSSQSLSTLALIEEFLGKREVPCLPGADGQGVQKWVRNVSYFREFTAALFLEPWQGLLKAFLSFSAFLSSTPFSTKCVGVSGVTKSREVLRASCYVWGTVLGAGELGQDTGRAEK